MGDSQTLYEKYTAELKGVRGVSASQSSDEDGLASTFIGSSPGSLKVELKWWQRGADFVLLDIEGVDTGYWHTAEEEDLDYHVGLAKAALLGQVAYNRSPILRRKEVCFKVGNAWECTLTDNAGSYHYIKTRKVLKSETSSLK
jgi:hypothetical protein